MPQTDLNERPIEWACKTILSVHFFLVLAGYINFIQTSYQLATPIIPKRTIELITTPYWKISLGEGIIFIISLWFYFLKFRVVTLVLSSISVVGYWLITTYFLHLL